MTEPRSTPIVETLRGRVLRGLEAGTLEPGERLPSARELVREFGVDHRLIIAAYRQLSDQGLVDIRERGGVYVASPGANRIGQPPLPIKWFVDMLTEAFAHEIAAPELHEWLRRSIETLRLRAVVVSTTADQVGGLARELRDDFGLVADGITGEELSNTTFYPPALRRADLIVATKGVADVARTLADELQKPLYVVDVRPDLEPGEWALLLRRPVWAVVATAEFGEMLLRFFADVRGIENLHILIFGRDDLSAIPEGAPTYVTHHVREQLAGTPIPGRILPAVRTISTESARLLFDFIVHANLDAMSAMNASRLDALHQRPSAP